jgi:hypothetical protein
MALVRCAHPAPVPPPSYHCTVASALTYAAVWVIAIATWQAGRPDLIRSPRLGLAHVWEGVET